MPCTVDVFVVPPFEENSYLLSDTDSGVALAIDPGGRVDEILERARVRGVQIELIANTHGHIDHVTGVADLKDATGAPFRIHPDAAATFSRIPERAAQMGMGPVRLPTVDGPLGGGDTFTVGGLTVKVRYTPGHAPGHVTLVIEDAPMDGGARTLAFCGDVIFRGSIGRTDMPGGDYEQLMNVIEREILTLTPDTVLLSGHGPDTTVSHEAATNPFVLDWLARSS